MGQKYKIQVKNLHKSFNNKSVLEGLSLDFPNKSSMVILGGSGTGKSVLIKNIVGLIKPDKGKILIDGQDTVNISTAKRFALLKKMGFLFQGGGLFDSLNIMDNITFNAVRLYNLEKSEVENLAVEKLSAVGLNKDNLYKYPSELSGGMLKRVSLARAICMDPEIVFFDEPTTGLDPIMANVINRLIIKAREELGITTVTITHDLNSAKMIASDIALLYQGKVIWSGKKEDMSVSDNAFLHQFINGITEGPMRL